jgi:hypothetical protein
MLTTSTLEIIRSTIDSDIAAGTELEVMTMLADNLCIASQTEDCVLLYLGH